MDYENYPVVNVSLDKALTNEVDDIDPFGQSWDVLKTYRNQDVNFRRSVTRKALGTTPAYESDSKMNPSGADAESKQINPGKQTYINGYGAYDVINPPYNLYVLSGFYDTSFANHAAIDAKVQSATGAGYTFGLTNKAKQKLSDAGTPDKQTALNKKFDRTKVAVQDWIESTNDQDSFIGTLSKVLTDYETTGNGYMEIGRTVTGQIGYIGHIPSTTIRVRRLKDGFVQIIGQRVVYFKNFGAKNGDPIGNDPTPNEIIHFKKYSPLNTYYGVPDIVSAATSVVGDQQAEQYNLEYFENKAVPRYIITLKGAKLSADAEQKLFRFLQTNLKGQNHRTLFVPLPPDADGNKVEFNMEPIENKIQDASFEEYRKTNLKNILLAHQVPLSKIGVAENSGVAAAATQDRTFRDNVIRPLQRYVEKAVSAIIKEISDIVEFALSEVSVVDANTQAQIDEIYLTTGVKEPNEVRDGLGLPQVEGLDEKAQSTRDARDRARSQNASDSPATATGRNPKGSGAKEDKTKK